MKFMEVDSICQLIQKASSLEMLASDAIWNCLKSSLEHTQRVELQSNRVQEHFSTELAKKTTQKNQRNRNLENLKWVSRLLNLK